MYYPSTPRQQYYILQPRYPQQPLQYRHQFYPPQLSQFYAQSLYTSYNGFPQQKVAQQYIPPQSSKTLQSPQKNFQSPVRGYASPTRNGLMQSQQQQPTQQQSLMQSPTRPGYLTYEQVMERINKAQQSQPQQSQPQLPKQQTLQVPIQQPKQQQQQQQQQKPQPQPSSQKPLSQQQQIQPHTPEPNKVVQPPVQPPVQQQQPEDEQQQDQENNENENDGQLEELALQYEDGYIYRGQGYAPQTRSGFGMLTDSEGREVYAGYWKENFYEGQGRLQNLNVEPIEGQFDWNNMTNIGNGWETYEGMFAEGKMHGQGTLVLSNGEKYNGEFNDGMIHGEGEYTTIDNQVIKGNWDQGYLVQVNEE